MNILKISLPIFFFLTICALGSEETFVQRIFDEGNRSPLVESLEEYCFVSRSSEGDEYMFEVKSILTFDEKKLAGIEIESVEFSFFDSNQNPVHFHLAHLWNYKVMSSRTIGYVFRFFAKEKDRITCLVRVNGYGYKKLPVLRAIPIEISAIRRVEPIATTTNPNKVP